MRTLVAVLAIVFASLQAEASAAPLLTNLIVNGDAELGNINSWTSGFGNAPVQVTDHVGPFPEFGIGLPAGVSIGQYVFTGGLAGPGDGSYSQVMRQVVDLSGFALLIDAGLAQADFRALVEDRVQSPLSDTVNGTVRYLNAAGSVLASFTFNDPTNLSGQYDWFQFADSRLLPTNTRKAEVTFSFFRSGGSSTDSAVDNVSLQIADRSAPANSVPEPASLALVTVALAVLGLGRGLRA
jgi:hypothetical protein